DGRTWTEVTPRDLPEWTLISIIEPSHRDAGTAYVAATRYKLDDPTPYLLKTTDGGSSWTSITEGIPKDEYTRVIREDPAVPGLLYCGTERGVYVSFDDGAHWESIRLNLPGVPVHDLEVKGTDLVAATHGRSFWILDDLTPIRELATDSNPDEVRLFTPRDTVRATTFGRNRRLNRIPDTSDLPMLVAGSYLAGRPDTGDPAVWLDAGTNVPGVIIQYYLDHPVDQVSVSIQDAKGETVADLTSGELAAGDPRPRLKTTAGSHRVVWDARYPGATPIAETGSAARSLAPLAPPGEYTVTLQAGDARARAAFRLLAPPNVSTTAAQYEEQFQLLVRVRDQVSRIHEAYNRISTLRGQVTEWETRLRDRSDAEALRESLSAVKAGADAARDRLVQWRYADFQDDINYPPMLNLQVAHIYQVAASADAPPTSQTYEALETLTGQVEEELRRVESLMAEEVAAFNAQARDAGLPALS
ncbi:MAG: glycosyl hydrolase, partial [Clostridia bacterium]